MSVSSKIFEGLRRNEFRRYFQPSRIALCVLKDPNSGKFNIITLSFNMHCSYKPPMMAFAISKEAFSQELVKLAQYCVLGVPGESLAEETLFCGTHSGREHDKIKECGLSLLDSETVPVPGISRSIANIEIEIVNRVPSGDHLTVFGNVLKYGVNRQNHERCLISVGPDHRGYHVLVSRGIQRIAVPVDANLA